MWILKWKEEHLISEFSDIWPLEYLDHSSKSVSFVVTKLSWACKPQLGDWPGICSSSALGILISRILKVAITKERPSGGTKATKQPYKLNRTVLVAISLPWVVNHSVCRREVYVVCAQSATTSKLWEGTERGGREGVVPFQWLMVNLKGPGL